MFLIGGSITQLCYEEKGVDIRAWNHGNNVNKAIETKTVSLIITLDKERI